jgi:hypothetical protein
MRAFLVFPLLSAALWGCPPKEQQTTTTTPPPSDPASQPASQPAKTSTTSMRGVDPADRDQIDADGVVRRGMALSPAAPMSIGEVLAQADTLAGKSVKVTGTVASVCAKKGCWFVIKDGERAIRITAKDYGFFVPARASGMVATLEGQLSISELDEAEVKHLESEGASPQGAKEVAIAAAAVEMKQAG